MSWCISLSCFTRAESPPEGLHGHCKYVDPRRLVKYDSQNISWLPNAQPVRCPELITCPEILTHHFPFKPVLLSQWGVWNFRALTPCSPYLVPCNKLTVFHNAQVSVFCLLHLGGRGWFDGSVTNGKFCPSLNYLEKSKLSVFPRITVIIRGKFYLNDPSLWQGKHLITTHLLLLLYDLPFSPLQP